MWSRGHSRVLPPQASTTPLFDFPHCFSVYVSKMMNAYIPYHLIWNKQKPAVAYPRKEFPLGGDATLLGDQVKAINNELRQDWALPSAYQRALKSVEHYDKTTMMELLHFMLIQSRFVFRGRIPEEHHHQMCHNLIVPLIAAYGPGGECVLEEVEEVMPRIKDYIDWVVRELGVGFCEYRVAFVESLWHFGE